MHCYKADKNLCAGSSRIAGRRTLELAFQDDLGVSLARYVAVLRLNATRRDRLSASEDNLCVAEPRPRSLMHHVERYLRAKLAEPFSL
jgi:hypothetical protein